MPEPGCQMDGGIHRVAALHHGPFLPKKQVGAAESGKPRQAVADAESFAHGDAHHAVNARQIVAARGDDAGSAHVAGSEERSGLLRPGAAAFRVGARFGPGHPAIRRGVRQPVAGAAGDYQDGRQRTAARRDQGHQGCGGQRQERQDRQAIAGVVVGIRPELGNVNRGAGRMYAPDVEHAGQRQQQKRPESPLEERRDNPSGGQYCQPRSHAEPDGGAVIEPSQEPIALAGVVLAACMAPAEYGPGRNRARRP